MQARERQENGRSVGTGDFCAASGASRVSVSRQRGLCRVHPYNPQSQPASLAGVPSCVIGVNGESSLTGGGVGVGVGGGGGSSFLHSSSSSSSSASASSSSASSASAAFRRPLYQHLAARCVSPQDFRAVLLLQRRLQHQSEVAAAVAGSASTQSGASGTCGSHAPSQARTVPEDFTSATSASPSEAELLARRLKFLQVRARGSRSKLTSAAAVSGAQDEEPGLGIAVGLSTGVSSAGVGVGGGGSVGVGGAGSVGVGSSRGGGCLSRKRKRAVARLDRRHVLRCVQCGLIESAGRKFGDYVLCAECGSSEFAVCTELAPEAKAARESSDEEDF